MGIREQVFESLDNALENDALQFEGSGDLVEQIAIDLGTHDAGLEGKEPEELRPHIVAWMASKPLIMSIWAKEVVVSLAYGLTEKRYYESHVTMQTDPVLARAAVEALGWKFSCIDGDPVLGNGVKCYATTFHKASKAMVEVRAELDAAARQLHDAGCQVVRKKIELVVFDEKVG